MAAIITLTTDFGLQDTYVAAMKGVILDINPKVTLVDICHSIEPQNIPQAAFLAISPKAPSIWSLLTLKWAAGAGLLS